MRMQRRSLRVATTLAVGMAAVALSAGGAGATEDHDTTGRAVLATLLAGANERGTPGDPDGRGSAVLVVDGRTGTICYRLGVRGIEPAAAAHIHEIADAIGNGPVVQELNAPTDGSSRGCAVNPDVARGLLEDPSDYYVNVHNAPFPAGVVRGDLG
jgi:hypothetical protein